MYHSDLARIYHNWREEAAGLSSSSRTQQAQNQPTAVPEAMSYSPRRSTRIAASRGTTPVASTYAASNVGTTARRGKKPESGALPALPTTQSIRATTTGFVSALHGERTSVSPEASERGSSSLPGAGTDLIDGGDVTTSQDVSKSFGLTHETGAGVGDQFASGMPSGRRFAHDRNRSETSSVYGYTAEYPHNNVYIPSRRRTNPPVEPPATWRTTVHTACRAAWRTIIELCFRLRQLRWYNLLWLVPLGLFLSLCLGFFSSVGLTDIYDEGLGAKAKAMIPNPLNIFRSSTGSTAHHTIWDPITGKYRPSGSIYETLNHHDTVIRQLERTQVNLIAKDDAISRTVSSLETRVFSRIKTIEEDYSHTSGALNRVNFFSAALGAVVDPHLTSPTQVKSRSWVQHIWTSLPFVYMPRPRPAIAALEPMIEAGDCWCAAQSTRGQAQLAVLMPKSIYPSSVAIEHVPKSGAPDIKSAPKDFEIWAQISDKPTRERILFEMKPDECTDEMPAPGYACIGAGRYDPDRGHHVQNFDLMDMEQFGVPINKVVVRVKSNWGQGWTCIYRVRMHGSMA